jgi:uncharacterized phiE125 gp8 family phage protein
MEMGLKIVMAPTTEPLTPAEAKQYLRAEGEDDSIISSLIKQAREWCEDYQGKKFITQTLELVLDSFPTEFEFRDCSPVQSITSIKYTDSSGTETTIPPADYILDNDSFVNRIVPAYGKSWPSVTLQPVNSIRVRFVAGYGAASAVPESVKWAMVLHMRLLYDDYKPDERVKIEKARDALLGMRRVIPV